MIGAPPVTEQLGHAAGAILHDAPAGHAALLVGADRDGHRAVRPVHTEDLPWIEERDHVGRWHQ